MLHSRLYVVVNVVLFSRVGRFVQLIGRLIFYSCIYPFIRSFICSASNTCLKKHIKTHCKVSWTTRQCTYCCHDKKWI